MALSGRKSQSPDHEDIFHATVKDFANQAYRTILCCYRDMSMRDYEQYKRNNNNFALEKDRFCLEQDLIAIGLFGIQDPLRDTIVSSVREV
jgi:magnesium-transporting ATPase (P-type)